MSREYFMGAVARARRSDDENKEEEAAICTVARRQRYFAAIVNTFERDIIRPRGYIKISASLVANIDDPYVIPCCARAMHLTRGAHLTLLCKRVVPTFKD